MNDFAMDDRGTLLSLNTDYLCPNCQSSAFQIGPRGGTAVNIRCVGCGLKYWFCPPFAPAVINNDPAVYGKVVDLSEWVKTQ